MVNREQIIKMAREAHGPITGQWWDMDVAALERFYALAYAAGQRDMRERAAAVCAGMRHPWGWSAETQDWVGATEYCSDAIRALPIEGEKA